MHMGNLLFIYSSTNKNKAKKLISDTLGIYKRKKTQIIRYYFCLFFHSTALKQMMNIFAQILYNIMRMSIIYDNGKYFERFHHSLRQIQLIPMELHAKNEENPNIYIFD